MKIIKLKCVCGAKIEYRDGSDTPVDESLESDKHNRFFQIEVYVDQWLDRHQRCIDKSNIIHLDGIKPENHVVSICHCASCQKIRRKT